MNNYYLDASALLKRYLREAGSEWVIEITNPENRHSIYLSHLTLAEVAAVFAAKSRAPGGISQRRRQRLLGAFLAECEDRFLLIPVHPAVIERAIDLSQQYRLRGYDSVQLATALEVKTILQNNSASDLRFIASDQDLLLSAQAEGLTGIDPETQP